MTTDESGQLSELTLETESQSNVNTSQDGTLSAPPDVDTRPIGACYNELQEVRAAGLALRAAVERAKTANARFWACRDAATESVPTASAINWRSRAAANSFDFIASIIIAIEKMIEDGTQATQEVS